MFWSTSLESLNTEMSVPEINVMSPSPTKARRADHDTGFPDPFPGTSLPHPDADLSPNATISHSDDSALGLALKRRRHTLLRKRRRNVSNHGYITPQTEAIHSILSLGLISMDEPAQDREGEGARLVTSPTVSTARFSKDDDDDVDADDMGRRRDSWKRSVEDTPPTSPDTAYSDYAESKKRHSFLGRLLRR